MNSKPSTAWAEAILARHMAGERLAPIQVEMAKRALGIKEPKKEAA